MTHAVADAGGEGGDASSLVPVLMGDGADCAGWCWEKQRTNETTHFMGYQRVRLFDEAGLERHGQIGCAEG